MEYAEEESNYSMRYIPAERSRKRFIPRNIDMEFMSAMPIVKALYLSERLRGQEKFKTEYQKNVERDELNVHLPISHSDILDVQNEIMLDRLGQRPFTRVEDMKLGSTSGHLLGKTQYDHMGLSSKYLPKPNPKELFEMPTFINPVDYKHKESLYKRFIKPSQDRPEKMSLKEAQNIKIDRHRPLLPTILY
jgi:hypothetical protein